MDRAHLGPYYNRGGLYGDNDADRDDPRHYHHQQDVHHHPRASPVGSGDPRRLLSYPQQPPFLGGPSEEDLAAIRRAQQQASSEQQRLLFGGHQPLFLGPFSSTAEVAKAMLSQADLQERVRADLQERARLSQERARADLQQRALMRRNNAPAAASGGADDKEERRRSEAEEETHQAPLVQRPDYKLSALVQPDAKDSTKSVSAGAMPSAFQPPRLQKTQYSCGNCGKEFDDMITARRHEGPCRAPCNQKPSQLPRHRLFQAVKAQYSCEVCGKEFANVASVRRHEGQCRQQERKSKQVPRPKAKVWLCEVCEQKFVDYDEACRHEKLCRKAKSEEELLAAATVGRAKKERDEAIVVDSSDNNESPTSVEKKEPKKRKHDSQAASSGPTFDSLAKPFMEKVLAATTTDAIKKSELIKEELQKIYALGKLASSPEGEYTISHAGLFALANNNVSGRSEAVRKAVNLLYGELKDRHHVIMAHHALQQGHQEAKGEGTAAASVEQQAMKKLKLQHQAAVDTLKKNHENQIKELKAKYQAEREEELASVKKDHERALRTYKKASIQSLRMLRAKQSQ